MRAIDLLLATGLLLCLAHGTLKAQDTLCWTGAVSTDFTDNGNWSASPGGSASATAPTSATTIVFTTGASNHCVADAAVSVASVYMLDNTTADFDLDGNTLDVSGGFTQDGGTFYGGTAAIAIGGMLHITGGTFQGTSGTLSVQGGITEEVYGAFVAGTGTVSLPAPSTLSMSSPLHQLQVGTGALVVLDNHLMLDGTLGIDGTVFMSGYNIMVANSSPGAVTGGGGVADTLDGNGDRGIFLWTVGGTGTYGIPFIPRMGGPRAMFDIDVATAGTGGGLIGCIDFILDSAAYAGLKSKMDILRDATGADNRDYNGNHAWYIFYDGYTVPPVAEHTLRYVADDLLGTNIEESRLKAQIWEDGKWHAPAGTLDTAANTLTVPAVPTVFGLWMLVDGTSPNRNTYGGHTGLTCADAVELDSIDEGTVFEMEDTVMWFRFASESDVLNKYLISSVDTSDHDFVDSIKIYELSCAGALIYQKKNESKSILIDYFLASSSSDYFVKISKAQLSNSQFTFKRVKRMQQHIASDISGTDKDLFNRSYCDSVYLYYSNAANYPSYAPIPGQQTMFFISSVDYNGYGSPYDTIIVPTDSSYIPMKLPPGYYTLAIAIVDDNGTIIYSSEYSSTEPLLYFYIDDPNKVMSIVFPSNTVCQFEQQYYVATNTIQDLSAPYIWTIGGEVLGTGTNPLFNVGIDTFGLIGIEVCNYLECGREPGIGVSPYTDTICVDTTVYVNELDFSYEVQCNTNGGDSLDVNVTFLAPSNCFFAITYFKWDFMGYTDSSQYDLNPFPSRNYKQPPGLYPVKLSIVNSSSIFDTIEIVRYVELKFMEAHISGPFAYCDTSNLQDYFVSGYSSDNTYTWSVDPPNTLSPSSGESTSVDWATLGGGTLTLTVDSFNFCSVIIDYEIGKCCFAPTVAGNISYGGSSITDFDTTYTSGTGVLETTSEIVFNGTLNIDQNYTIRNSPNIRFGIDAKVIVQPGKTLTIENSKLQAGCDTMWDGIYVSSTYDSLGSVILTDSSIVRDAKNALVSEKGGRVIVDSSLLTNNYKHVVVRNYGNVVPLILDRAQSTSSGNLLPPYASRTQAIIGIEIDSVWQVSIGNYALATNSFHGADTIIKISNSETVYIDNNLIGNVGAGLFGITQSEYGIFARNVDNINIGHNEFNWVFSSRIGIDIARARETVIQNNIVYCNELTLPNYSMGIRVENQIPTSVDTTSRINISSNGVGGRPLFGVYLLDNSTRIEVRENTLLWDTTDAGLRFGYGIANSHTLTNPQTAPVEFSGNSIEDYTNALWVMSTPRSQIFDNSIKLRHQSNYFTPRGIYYANSPNSSVYCNEATGGNVDEDSTVGIWAQASPSSLVQCNTVDSMGRGIQFEGQNFFTYVVTNTISNGEVGLSLYKNARVGAIGFYTGLVHITFDNRWIGSSFNAHARTYSTPNLPLSDSILYRNNGSTELRPSPFITDIAGPSRVFPARSVVSFFDTTVLNCTVCDGAGKVDSFNKTQAYETIGDSIIYDEDSLIYRWWDKYALYNTLIDQPDLLEEDAELETFYNNYSTSFMPTLAGIRSDIRQIEFTGFTEGNINDIQGRLNALSPSNTIENNALDYTWQYFSMARGVQTYEDLEGDILAIAYQCVFYGGPAVVEARSLVATKDVMKYTIDWEESCVAPSSKRGGDEEEVQALGEPLADYKLVPNFYLGERTATITLNAEENGSLEVYSIDGKLAGMHSLSSGKNTLDLAKTLTTKGVYVYKVKVGGEYHNTDKLVVIE